jgi:diguanylate cyclase (GGDEF)-like protein
MSYQIDFNKPVEKSKQVSISMYSSSQGISMLALIIVAAFEIMMLMYTIVNPGLYGQYLMRYRMFYISLLGVAIAYIALNYYAKKDIENRYGLLAAANPACSIFFFVWSLLVTYSDSIITGTIDSSVFMTFSMVVPLIFTLIPAVYAGIVLLADAVMLYLIISVTGGGASLINVIIFFVFQFVLGIGFLRLKIKLAERIVQEEENARIDVMTSLPNRREYEEDLKQVSREPMPEDLNYVVIDINGLKDVNDNYGHEAGDRLIIGAAMCIEKVFNGWGRHYRIGGDEFVILLNAERDKVDELIRDFENCAKDWSKDNEVKLRASVGAAGVRELPGCGIIELARAADENMYEQKAKYYKSIGVDRRRYHTSSH